MTLGDGYRNSNYNDSVTPLLASLAVLTVTKNVRSHEVVRIEVRIDESMGSSNWKHPHETSDEEHEKNKEGLSVSTSPNTDDPKSHN